MWPGTRPFTYHIKDIMVWQDCVGLCYLWYLMWAAGFDKFINIIYGNKSWFVYITFCTERFIYLNLGQRTSVCNGWYMSAVHTFYEKIDIYWPKSTYLPYILETNSPRFIDWYFQKVCSYVLWFKKWLLDEKNQS